MGKDVNADITSRNHHLNWMISHTLFPISLDGCQLEVGGQVGMGGNRQKNLTSTWAEQGSSSRRFYHLLLLDAYISSERLGEKCLNKMRSTACD